MLPEEVIQAARTLHAYLPPAEATTFATYAKRLNIPLKVAPKSKINKELKEALAPLLKEKKLLEKGVKVTSKIDNVEFKYRIFLDDDVIDIELTSIKIIGVKSSILNQLFSDAVYNYYCEESIWDLLDKQPEYKQFDKQFSILNKKLTELSKKFPEFDIDTIFAD